MRFLALDDIVFQRGPSDIGYTRSIGKLHQRNMPACGLIRGSIPRALNLRPTSCLALVGLLRLSSKCLR